MKRPLNHGILSRFAAKNLYDDIRDSSLALRVTFLLLTVIASALLITQQVRAQSGIEMQSTATHQFGEQITFVAQVTAPIQIQQANIVIFDEAQAVTHVQPVEFSNGRSEYRFDTRQNLVRTFATIRWYYELTLSDGNILQSDAYSLRYDDNRFAWQKLEAGGGIGACGEGRNAETGISISKILFIYNILQNISTSFHPFLIFS